MKMPFRCTYEHVRPYRRVYWNSDHCLLAANIRERLSVRKRAM
jgi:hypothetical protein